MKIGSLILFAVILTACSTPLKSVIENQGNDSKSNWVMGYRLKGPVFTEKTDQSQGVVQITYERVKVWDNHDAAAWHIAQAQCRKWGYPANWNNKAFFLYSKENEHCAKIGGWNGCKYYFVTTTYYCRKP